MKKTDLQVMHEMNMNDTNYGTQTLRAAYTVVSSKKVKHGAVIEMGIEEIDLMKLLLGETIPVLFMLDKKTFFDIKSKEQ